MSQSLSFLRLRLANRARLEEIFHPLNDWSPMEWAAALAGETGEVCGAVKNLRRVTDGNEPADELRARHPVDVNEIAMELADTIIYADLLAARLGIDLSEAIVAKFNHVSAWKKSEVML